MGIDGFGAEFGQFRELFDAGDTEVFQELRGGCIK